MTKDDLECGKALNVEINRIAREIDGLSKLTLKNARSFFQDHNLENIISTELAVEAFRDSCIKGLTPTLNKLKVEFEAL